MEERIKWELINPEGIVQLEPFKVNFHPRNLEGKTVLLHWNGKHNGNVFLNRIGELFTEKVEDLKIIKSWEIDADTAQISRNPKMSEEIAQKLAHFKPDIVIGAQGD
ncbi:hypothetical protein ACFLW4_00230 [Chloroflexota bacterium]